VQAGAAAIALGPPGAGVSGPAVMGALAVLALAPALLAGCGPAPPVDCGDGPPTLDLGAGARAFLPFADGDPVFVLCGPQGGRHVLLRLRATGLGPQFGLSARLNDPAGGGAIAALDVGSSGFHREGAACVSDLFPVFMKRPTAEIAGAMARFEVSATDPLGRAAAAAVAVTVDTSMVSCAQ